MRVYQNVVPIPARMSTSFGLFENSQLYLAPLIDTPDRARSDRHLAEIIVSPVPIRSWASVCRLSVRLHDTPRALADATGFLRDQRINILLSECSSTYQDRAHFDAVCDLRQAAGYAAVRAAPKDEYVPKMEELLDKLTAAYRTFAAGHPAAFMLNVPDFVKFAPLTGLNELSFLYRTGEDSVTHHHAGALELPGALIDFVRRKCDLQYRGGLPYYALLTGNTEQRYMRILFMKDYEFMFRLIVKNHLQRVAGSGVGVLHQFLSALPKEVNLVRASNYIYDKKDDVELGIIDLIGYWDSVDESVSPKTFADVLRREMDALVRNLVIKDVDERAHANALELLDVYPATISNPRVYISYSITSDRSRLDLLMSALTDADYEPVLGTRDDPESGSGGDAAVWQKAVKQIPTCVAFISLQIKRDDYRVPVGKGKFRYLISPWLTAEEMYAWMQPSRPYMVRLRAREIDASAFTRDLEEETYDSNDPESFKAAVAAVIHHLNAFSETKRFVALRNDARRAQFQERYAPTGV